MCTCKSCGFSLSITVEALLTDTLVSGQLYLRPPSQKPAWAPTKTLYLHILVSGCWHFQCLRFRLFLCFQASVSGHPKGNPISLWITAESHFNHLTSHRCSSQWFYSASITVIAALHLGNKKTSLTALVASPLTASSSYGHLFRVPRVSAYESFHCIQVIIWSN